METARAEAADLHLISSTISSTNSNQSHPIESTAETHVVQQTSTKPRKAGRGELMEEEEIDMPEVGFYIIFLSVLFVDRNYSFLSSFQTTKMAMQP